MKSSKTTKVIFIMLLFLVIMSPIFAQQKTFQNDAKTETLDLSFIKNAVNLIVGVFAGGYVLLKAAIDIFHAVRNSSEDPNGLRKAIGGLVLNIAILAGFFFVLNFVFGAMKSGDATAGDAQGSFFRAISGVLVNY